MVVLSATALYFLREDKAGLEQEARDRARVLAPEISRALGARISQLMIHPAGPYRGGKIEDGRVTSPFDSSVPPLPPDWPDRLPPAEAGLWRDGSRKALTQLARSSTSTAARANAELALLALDPNRTAARYVDLARRYPGIETPSGANLEAVALVAALHASKGAPPTRDFLTVLARNTRFTPSFLTPQLLDEAGRASGASFEALTRIGDLDREWSNQQITVDAMREVLRLSPHSPQFLYWVGAGGQRFLAAGDPIRGGWSVRLLQNVNALFMQAFAASRSALPPYAAARVNFAGDWMSLTIPAPRNPKLLASGAGVIQLQSRHRFDLEILADTDALYAAWQRRLWLTSGLILSTAVAAFIGIFALWRGSERQARLAAMKTGFVSAVSHELRAPIGALRLMAESLERETVADPAKQKDYFRLIVQECRRLSTLVENVLDFSRMDSGRKQYYFLRTDLTPLLERAAALMEPIAAERHVALTVTPPAEELHPRWDAQAVEQALVNLLDNAIKHSPESAVVAVTVEALDGLVRVWVTDDGPGIPVEEQTRIFDLFYRHGSELRRETKGAGIGLAIVKHVAEAHGGRVIVESEPGKGSSFALELPK